MQIFAQNLKKRKITYNKNYLIKSRRETKLYDPAASCFANKYKYKLKFKDGIFNKSALVLALLLGLARHSAKISNDMELLLFKYLHSNDKVTCRFFMRKLFLYIDESKDFTNNILYLGGLVSYLGFHAMNEYCLKNVPVDWKHELKSTRR